jgi:hypothetical protein
MNKRSMEMLVEEHYKCDRPGCKNIITTKALNQNENRSHDKPIWYRLMVNYVNGTKYLDFCSLECISEQIKVDPEAIKHMPDIFFEYMKDYKSERTRK